MTQLWRKKKVEIVVEASRVPAITAMVERVGARGYTVIADVSGKGARGIRDDAHLSDVFRNMLIVVVASEEVVARIVDESQILLENYAGIVLVSDVEVVRNEHF